MIRVKVIGATGYGGVGMIEALLRHPQAEPVALVAVADVGKRIDEVYPHLAGFCDLEVLAADDERAAVAADLVVLATPDRVGMQLAPAALEQGARVIDYSGDFRFDDPAVYRDYATRLGRDPEHESAALLGNTVYGLPELHRPQIEEAHLVGNAGCFAVSCLLGLAPAADAGLVEPDSLICDCKTGVSGAGKKAKPAFHYPARYEQMNAYRLSGHQHVCEVERELALLAGEPVRVTFTAQVVPVCRGILSCLYGRLRQPAKPEEVLALYRTFYADHPFVRVYGPSADIGTAHVRGTNYANLVVDVDRRTGLLRVISHIDNLVKGQAGNAVQNMNLMFGLPETAGLDLAGLYP